ASIEDDFYAPFLRVSPNLSSVRNETYALLSRSVAALVTSGTATLETALFGVPQVVCYKGSAVSYAIAKRLVKIKYISLVNLIMDRPVVKELIQHEMNTGAVAAELNDLLHDPKRRAQVQEDYRQLREILQQGGNASARAAASILSLPGLSAHP
ncbi:MAG TPA: lipid-A-disaccharide synthase, partial [Chitinophagaceae bacterium]|nr:lipid-A-disaccharide synthase [Chitinophagaceae bacterium]